MNFIRAIKVGDACAGHVRRPCWNDDLHLAPYDGNLVMYRDKTIGDLPLSLSFEDVTAADWQVMPPSECEHEYFDDEPDLCIGCDWRPLTFARLTEKGGG